MMTDAEFLEQLSRVALERRASLAALARAQGVGAEDAVDCVQEGLITFLQRRTSVPENVSEWGAYLATIVQNAARNRRRRHFVSRPHDQSADSLAAAELPADELLARAEALVRLGSCVEELCEIQKAVVTMRMLEDKPGEDVGRALGISPGHVAVLLHRAKLALRACLTTR
jgi:RNA polymerase sigma-70 factor (ECF subfamily)